MNRLNKVVKELKSSEFGMTEEGGNGLAMVRKGFLVVKEPYFYFNQKEFDGFEDNWVEVGGAYAEYFKEKFGVRFNLVEKTDYRTKKLQGLPGYFEVVFSVSESN